MTFTHLQVKSGYSLFQSTIKIDQLVKRASELQFTALALTDEEVLYGVIPFYKACLKANIKPIIGMSLQIGKESDKRTCVLLAKNNVGYQQLIKISSLIHTEESEITLQQLSSYTNGLICILPIYQESYVSLLHANQEQLERILKQWSKVFNEDFYVGVQGHHEIDESVHLNVKNLTEDLNISAVAMQDVLYLDAKDYPVYDCLQAIEQERVWKAKDLKPSGNHLCTREEMHQHFGEIWPDIIVETNNIQKKCHVTFDFNQQLLPSYPVENDGDAHTYLEKFCWKYVKEKYTKLTKEVSERLTYELEMIKKMGFSDYFLIVADFINYAKENQILVGPGRGSAAGSIVSYVMGITDIDPLRYNLLFERFLNPERQSMPDIDIDFSDHRRDEVIDYVRKKYGEEHVAQIITFGTFGARSTLRELFKVMEVNSKDAAYILSKIPVHANASIASYVKEQPDFKAYIVQSSKLRNLFKIATKLQGLPRHISTHAAGVVMSDDPLIKHIPLTLGSNGRQLSQYPMNDLEAIGLLKMDFLGLRNLTFLEKIIQSIEYKTKENIQLNEIPLNDAEAFKLLQEGKTNGVFQLESRGMRDVLNKLKPTSFEDIVAVNALYRPGPMDYIATYIERKHGREEVTYLHPDLAPILSPTYGVLVYQEQIMQIASKIAGYSLGEADILRRAVSKKDSELMKEQEKKFIQGCLASGYDEAIAREIFLWIVKFSNYGFNRSHAVAYSKISYQLAYLKAHYPAIFLTELLNGQTNQKEKTLMTLKEARESSLTILPPSINKSFGRHTVEGKAIRIGLHLIKGINHNMIKEIIEKRKQRAFQHLFDFCLRVSLNIVNRRVLQNLILAGAFDETHENRASLLASIDQAIDQGELFGDLSIETNILTSKFGVKEMYTEVTDFNPIKKMSDEKELIGFHVSKHPLQSYREQLTKSQHVPLEKVAVLVGKRNIQSTVILESIREIRTKRGDPMAFITISDETNEMEAVVFPELYRNKKKLLTEESIITLKGKAEERNGKTQMLLANIDPFDIQLLNESNKRLFIQLTKEDSSEALRNLKEIADQFPGNIPVIIYHKEKQKTYKLTNEYNLDINDRSLHALEALFDENNVVLKG